MISRDIVDYVKAQIEKGASKEDVKNALASAGWQMADIQEAFRYAEQNIPIASAPAGQSYSYQPGQGGQNAATLASPTDLLKEAWGIYKARFKTFIGIILAQFGLIMIPVIVMGIIAIIYAMNMAVPGKSVSIVNIVNFGLAGFTIILVPLTVIIFYIIAMWGQAAMLFAVKDTEEGIGIKESYRRGWHKIGSIFWVGLLSNIIVTGGFLLLIIPGIIFAIWFSLATMIIVAESLGGMNAILKSKEYVRGYWWEVFWRFLFIGLILIAVNLAFSVPVGIINIIAAISNSSALAVLGSIISFLGNIISFLLTPLTVVYTFLIYKNLKTIKGEVKSEFSSGEKIKYILVGLLGIILFFGFIIGSIILVSLNSARGKAMDASRQASLQSLQGPLILYADDHNNFYPSTLNQLIPEYVKTIPVDPATKLPYDYRLLKNGKDYELCARLDNGVKKCVNGYGSLNPY